jgi:hypothetical protein
MPVELRGLGVTVREIIEGIGEKTDLIGLAQLYLT